MKRLVTIFVLTSIFSTQTFAETSLSGKSTKKYSCTVEDKGAGELEKVSDPLSIKIFQLAEGEVSRFIQNSEGELGSTVVDGADYTYSIMGMLSCKNQCFFQFRIIEAVDGGWGYTGKFGLEGQASKDFEFAARTLNVRCEFLN